MKLIVAGKGKTGALVAEVARERGHQASILDSVSNQHAGGLAPEKIRGVDVVIDFTTPQAVLENIRACARAGTNMVVGTTGWYSQIDAVRGMVEEHQIGLVYASNFSVGMSLFFSIAQAAARALSRGYNARITEHHHSQKKDSPSGTALRLQTLLAQGSQSLAEITSIREGENVGIHIIELDSADDTITLQHNAKSRRGFAAGALLAAEWVAGKRGFYEFKEVLDSSP